VPHLKHCGEMPQYFFDLFNDIEASDDEGRELPDVDAVVAAVLREVREMIRAAIAETGRIDLRHRIDVRDESGNIVYVMHFEDAVTIQRGDEILNRASIRISA
jgi:hypothetical protein